MYFTQIDSSFQRKRLFTLLEEQIIIQMPVRQSLLKSIFMFTQMHVSLSFRVCNAFSKTSSFPLRFYDTSISFCAIPSL